MLYQETGRAVVLVCLQRRVGLRGRLFAAYSRIGSFGTGREGALAAGYGPIPKIQAALRTSGCSLPPRIFILRAAGDGEDFSGIGAGRALWVVDLHGQSGG